MTSAVDVAGRWSRSGSGHRWHPRHPAALAQGSRVPLALRSADQVAFCAIVMTRLSRPYESAATGRG